MRKTRKLKNNEKDCYIFEIWGRLCPPYRTKKQELDSSHGLLDEITRERGESMYKKESERNLKKSSVVCCAMKKKRKNGSGEFYHRQIASDNWALAPGGI